MECGECKSWAKCFELRGTPIGWCEKTATELGLTKPAEATRQWLFSGDTRPLRTVDCEVCDKFIPRQEISPAQERSQNG